MNPHYTRAQAIPLLTLHSELSKLHHAVNLLFDDIPTDITIQWRNGVYLTVDVECLGRHKMKVVDRLKHGALTGQYDYRFKCVSYPTMGEEPWEYVVVSAMVDLCHEPAVKLETA